MVSLFVAEMNEEGIELSEVRERGWRGGTEKEEEEAAIAAIAAFLQSSSRQRGLSTTKATLRTDGRTRPPSLLLALFSFKKTPFPLSLLALSLSRSPNGRQQ